MLASSEEYSLKQARDKGTEKFLLSNITKKEPADESDFVGL